MKKVFVFIFLITMVYLPSHMVGQELETPKSERSEEDVDLLMAMDLEDLLEVEVVTASKKAQKIGLAPADMFVVTESIIRDRGYRDLKDIFRDLPGFDISENLEGEVRTLVISRGLLGNNKLMILRDGKKLNTSTGERFMYGNNLPLFNVKRIEIIYGPSSAMYGADAYSGVINMISKTADDIDGFQIDVGYDVTSTKSTRSTFQESVLFGKKFGDDFSVMASFRKYNSQGEDVSDLEEYQDEIYTTNNPRGFHQSTDNYNIYGVVEFKDLKLGFYRMDAKEPNGYSTNPTWFVFDDSFVWRQKINKVFLDHTYRAFDDNLEVVSSLEYSDYEVGNESNFNYPFGKAYKFAKTSSVKLEEKMNLNIPSIVELSAGASIEAINAFPKTSNLSSKFDGSNLADNMSPGYVDGVMATEELKGAAASGVKPFKKAGVYIEATKKVLDNLQFNAGVRYDFSTNHTPKNIYNMINPRLGAIWAPGNATFKLLYGEAYIQPSEYDKWENWSAGDFIAHIPNAKLEAETLRSLNLIMAYKLKDFLNIELSLFNNWASNIIRPVPFTGENDYADTIITSENRYVETNDNQGNQITRGGELKLNYVYSNDYNSIHAYAFYSLLDAFEDNADKTPISKVATHKVQAGATYTLFKKFSVSPRLRFSDKKNMATFAGVKSDKIEGNVVFDISLRASRFFYGLSAYANITNLLDAKYHSASPFGEGPSGWLLGAAPQPRRNIAVGISYDFNF